ncbi:MAG: hypothetical protein DRJ66_02475 [Thermoprotei archaeon]|nr:MAG: hypothetical protein DRJ66_02475 [Thermoprotei archaeon]RLF20907.1 MAG: hypothetical protein DRZ82_00450 [Thermoprotei archaeon]
MRQALEIKIDLEIPIDKKTLLAPFNEGKFPTWLELNITVLNRRTELNISLHDLDKIDMLIDVLDILLNIISKLYQRMEKHLNSK